MKDKMTGQRALNNEEFDQDVDDVPILGREVDREAADMARRLKAIQLIKRLGKMFNLVKLAWTVNLKNWRIL
ncbi:unnamed protein product [Dovyalis caffra]|uniref:Uncharacterized protein n=1 Tax=Dovyalis caffra TaxID=77055 RepID=A0AAV1SH80_9ROSI|nr:unnamed protein product [Dovyalis caffra]